MKQMQSTVRLIDIARKVGVSSAVVGNVLQGTGKGKIRVGKETAMKIRKVAREFNYRPNIAAQQLAGKKCKMIGMLMNTSPTELNANRLALMEARVRSLGYHLMVMHEELFPQPKEEQVRDCLLEFASRGVDGLICMHHTCRDNPGMIPDVIKEYFRNVIFIDEPESESANFVGPDWVDGARQAVRYLFNRGYKRIGLVLADLKWYGGPRLKEGYVQEVEAQGQDFDENLLWVSNKTLLDSPQDLMPEDAANVFEELILKNGADAIFTGNDFWAGQLINAIRDKGYSVPEDVGVMGWGDSHFVHYTRPVLSSVNLQIERVCSAAVEYLIDMLEDREENGPKRTFIKPMLVPRGST